MTSHELSSGSTLLVDGPASILLTRGEASSYGAPLDHDAWIVIRQDQRVPLETPSACSMEIRLGRAGRQEKINGSTIPTGWKEASQISLQAPGVVMVLGDVDSGKSSLSLFLVNESIRQGTRVSIIDGDVGQADIGPPTTISMSNVRQHVFSLQHLKPDISLFMGDTSPSTVPEKVSSGLLRLRDLARKGSDLVIVNTDGWLRGEEAFRYKTQLLESIRPDMVFGIDLREEGERLLNYQKATALNLARSSYARTRTREERRHAREAGYKRFLKDAKPVNISLSDVKVRRFNSFHQLKIHGSENLRGLIAGLLDEEDRLLSISRIEGLKNDVVKLRAVLEARPRTVELGSVVLSSKYEELGYDA